MTPSTSFNMDYIGSQIIYEKLDNDKKMKEIEELNSAKLETSEISNQSSPQSISTQSSPQYTDLSSEVGEERKQQDDTTAENYNPFLHPFGYFLDLAKKFLFNPQPHPDPTKPDTLTEHLIIGTEEVPILSKEEKQSEAQVEVDKKKEIKKARKEQGLNEYIKYGLL